MRITRLELKNFRTFGHALFENIPDTVVLVSPNGRGKSSILEAIAGVHDLVVPYHQDTYPFMMSWQQQHVPFWPNHLPEPVKIGERKAEVHIEVQATGQEIDYLQGHGIRQPIGIAHFVIEDRRYVATRQVDTTIQKLFQYHNPKDGIGFVDYIRPIRFYQNRPIGDFASDLSDNRTRQVFSEFYRPYNQHEKFASLKSFVVSTQLTDYSQFIATKKPVDSLALFREVFDHFFAPKKFVGYRVSGVGGQAEVVVESPFGAHDTDALSDGEKEALHIFAHHFRFRGLDNIVLWDTPELHLNAALESRLYESFRKIAPRNQYWVATHSLEFINSVPLDCIFVIRQQGTCATVERATGEERRARIGMYREMGAQIGLQLVSSVVVFVEGKEANSDKRLLDRLIAPQFPGVNFIAGGSCESLLSAGTRANRLLSEACTNGDFLAIVDRDYRDDQEMERLAAGYNGRLFMWEVHEIENLLIEPAILFETLKFLDHLKPEEDCHTILDALKAVAVDLKDWIAADWVAWEFDKAFQPPSRRIGGDDPKGSLQSYATALQSKVLVATDAGNLDARFQEKVSQVGAVLSDGSWLRVLPGKQLLKKFLERYPTLRPDDYMRAATSIVLDRRLSVPELDRLKSVLRQLPEAR
jgi:predicted ATPase